MAWWRRLSLRTRLTVIGAAGLAAGLALGGLMLIAALQWTLQRTLDDGALRTAHDVAALVDAGEDSKRAMAEVARATGVPRREVYQAVLDARADGTDGA